MRLIVLGSTGMLGSEVARVSRAAGIDLIEVSRTQDIQFDATSDSFEDLASLLSLGEADYLVNCIGWIPQKASGSISDDRQQAWLLNTDLPRQINDAVLKHGFKWIQIGTDCVFSGETGGYTESSKKDALDLYGVSKIEGEKLSSQAMLIRSSIIGPDNRTRAGLYSWFKGELAARRAVTGFSNHLWNGVSTTAFARLAIGLSKSGRTKPFTAHWVPADSKSKREILELFAKHLGAPHDFVVAGNAPSYLDRTLETNDPSLNNELWKLAGYAAPPTIEELVAELVAVDQSKEVN